MSETQKQILYQKALRTDLQRLGYMETTNLTFLMNYSKQYTDYIENMMRLGVAQAMLQGIGTSIEASLIIRDLSPMEDLLTGLVNGPVERLHSNAWIQDYTKTLATCRSELGGDEKVMGRFDIYETNKWVKNDQKVIVIYGLEFLNPVKRTLATEIMFWRGHVKLESRYPIPHKFAMKQVPEFKDMTIVDYDNRNDGKKEKEIESKGIKYASNMFYHNPVIFFDTPIIYGKDSLMRITSQVPMNRLSTTEHENIDEIKILGFTIEPIGLTCMG